MNPSAQGGGTFLSLERKLPVLIGALVAAALLATLLIVRHELRSSGLDTASDRLAMVGEQLRTLTDASLETRQTLMNEVAGDPAVTAFAAGTRDDVAAVQAALERLRTPTDSGLPIQIRSANDVVLTELPAPAPRDGVTLPAAPPAELMRADTIAYSPLVESADGVSMWAVTPILVRDSVVARIFQQRRVGAGSGEALRNLIGGDAEIYFTNRAGGVWVSLDGYTPDGPPMDSLQAPVVIREGDSTFLALAEPVAGTPWLVVLRQPMREVLGRADAVVRRLAIAGALLLLLGLLGAWLVSRSVTRPLRRLRDAADAIAAGDYGRRTGFTSDDELGRVARSFDVMAEQVQANHTQTAQRYEEAQRLAAELERANHALTESVADAEAARIQAQAASQAKSDFLATMSHEIRTPINAVVGYTDLLDMGITGALTEQQRDYIARIRVGGEHLAAIVNDVLDFAKIESGQLNTRDQVGALADEVRATADMLQATATARRLALTTACDDAVHYRGDPQRVRQILVNLVSNGVKFTPDEGSVRVTCEERESHAATGNGGDTVRWACAVVADTGVGIEPDQLEAIFEPFVQGSRGYTRSHAGTGLGLAISRSLARLMGGDITVESEPGTGSTFTLWLPAA